MVRIQARASAELREAPGTQDRLLKTRNGAFPPMWDIPDALPAVRFGGGADGELIGAPLADARWNAVSQSAEDITLS
jgi:hypothetical protein